MNFHIKSLDELKDFEETNFTGSLLKERLSFSIDNSTLIIATPMRAIGFSIKEDGEHWLAALTYVRAYYDGAIQQARDIHGI